MRDDSPDDPDENHNSGCRQAMRQNEGLHERLYEINRCHAYGESDRGGSRQRHPAPYYKRNSDQRRPELDYSQHQNAERKQAGEGNAHEPHAETADHRLQQ